MLLRYFRKLADDLMSLRFLSGSPVYISDSRQRRRIVRRKFDYLLVLVECLLPRCLIFVHRAQREMSRHEVGVHLHRALVEPYRVIHPAGMPVP